MKLLNGSDLVGYIKERQARQVSYLKSSKNLTPKLAIIVTVNDPVIEIYLKLKKKYGIDIGAEVELFRLSNVEKVIAKIKELNMDSSFQGIIIQLPFKEEARTEEVVNLVSPSKDVDGLGKSSKFQPATPMAILWLLSGYNVNFAGKDIAIVGRGRLVGRPLEKALKSQGLNPVVINKSTKNMQAELKNADIIITATGVPGLIKPDMIKQNAVVIDAGVASEDGKTVGDVDEQTYSRDDLTITPKKGGVGPLTVSALFDNLIQATEKAKPAKRPPL